MNFNAHGNYVGKHALLSPSEYHWINYDEEKLRRVFFTRMQAQRGTELHELAHQAIRLRVRFPDEPTTLNLYVNDAIGYRMTPEVMLVKSENCFGHADTLGFSNNKLRIHDLKTGTHEASFHQLEIYAALFCIEYGFKPFEIEVELRIYQNNEVRVYVPEPDVLYHIIDRIQTFDKLLNYLREEAAG